MLTASGDLATTPCNDADLISQIIKLIAFTNQCLARIMLCILWLLPRAMEPSIDWWMQDNQAIHQIRTLLERCGYTSSCRLYELSTQPSRSDEKTIIHWVLGWKHVWKIPRKAPFPGIRRECLIQSTEIYRYSKSTVPILTQQIPSS